MKNVELRPNEQSVLYAPFREVISVEIPENMWIRDGQIEKIIFHDNTYIERDVTDPHTIHVRKK